MINARIAGTGSALPDRVLTNQDLEKIVDTSDEWIRTRTGIERRHIVADDEATSDLAIRAARNAMEAAGVQAADVDMIFLGTTTPDLVFPNVATMVQHELGIRACPAFSLEAACSGFLYALSVADKFVRDGSSKCALVIGAECLSRITNWEDRNTCVLFGDGAGAVVLEPGEEQGVVSTHLGADGQYQDLLYCSSGPSKFTEEFARGHAHVQMTGNEVFKVAVKTLSGIAEKALAANELASGAVDWFIPHQANFRIIQATAKRLDFDMERVILTVQDHGNTSAASIPLALDAAVRDGRIQRGQLLLMVAFGGGFTWGSALVRY